MGKVFCFGELLVRISLPPDVNWVDAKQSSLFLGGAELNVAQALNKWKQPVRFMTALPENHIIADEAFDYLHHSGVDVSTIVHFGTKLGAYYLKQGSDLKKPGVVYDREVSSFSLLRKGMLDWDELLKDCSWFHFSAITPAMNRELAAVCEEGLKAAVQKNMKISVDLNYRAKLWNYGEAPPAIMDPLLNYCNLVMGNLWSVEKITAVKSPVESSNGISETILKESAVASMNELKKKYPAVKEIFYTFRLANEYFAVVQNEMGVMSTPSFPVLHMADGAGSGDCFMAGIIYGKLQQWTTERMLHFAVAAAIGKLNETGDATSQTMEQINERVTKMTKQ